MIFRGHAFGERYFRVIIRLFKASISGDPASFFGLGAAVTKIPHITIIIIIMLKSDKFMFLP